MKVYMLLDPLESPYGPIKPSLLLAKELKKNFDILV